MAKISPFKFLQEVRAEADKVTWPTRRETMITTAMVFVMVAVASVLFLVADQIIRVFITFILGVAAYATKPLPKRSYIVYAYSNFEKQVQESIRDQAKQRGLADHFEQIMVPTEKVTEVRRGRKIDAERKFFPGYVLVKIKLTDEAFHLIKNTPKVTGFLGAENKPMPVSESQGMRILHEVQEGVERQKASVSFEIGENVRVADGPFASFSGVVEEIDEARSRVKVAVSIFGRATPVELEFGQVEKV